MKFSLRPLIFASLFLLPTVLICHGLAAQQSNRNQPAPRPKNLQAQLNRTTEALGDHTYLLKYQHKSGNSLRYQVLHVVNVETTIEGNGQKSQSRSSAVKRWDVKDVTPQGATLSHCIEEVDMSSESPGRATSRYNSRTDKEVPGEYEEVAATIGKPIATLTVDAWGNTLSRKDELKHADLGAGGLIVSFPKERIKINAEWSQPGVVNVRLTDGEYKPIKIRQVYRLTNVASGIATISVTTQVMTPVPDARVQSQLLQRLCNGTVKFDIDAGRIVSRTMEWNENVVGFNGASSSMKYQARLTEELIDPARVATRPEKP